MKIFLIDDNELDLFITAHVLHEFAKLPVEDITTYQNPETALNDILTKKSVPDLIFLDVNMPLMDGFQFLFNLQMNNVVINTIILSSSDKPSDIVKATQSKSVVKYLVKPLADVKEILEYIAL